MPENKQDQPIQADNSDSTNVEQTVDGGKKNKDSAGLSYMPVICIFIYMSKKDDPFVFENAKQGVALFVLMVIGWIFSILVPIIGLPIVIAAVVFMVLGFMKAFSSGETVSIPFLSDYLKKHDLKDIIDSTMNSIQEGVDKVSKQADNVQEKEKDDTGNPVNEKKTTEVVVEAKSEEVKEDPK